MKEPTLEALAWWQYKTYEQPHYPTEHQNMGQCFVDGYRKGKAYMWPFVLVAFVAGFGLCAVLKTVWP